MCAERGVEVRHLRGAVGSVGRVGDACRRWGHGYALRWIGCHEGCLRLHHSDRLWRRGRGIRCFLDLVILEPTPLLEF